MIGAGVPSFVIVLVCAVVLVAVVAIAFIAMRALTRIATSLEKRNR